MSGKKRQAGHCALIIIDMQNDFLPPAPLGVENGQEIIPIINLLSRHFAHIIVTQDWHPLQHISFASRHQGKKAFDKIELAYGEQILWPDHCIQNSQGAQIVTGLDISRAELILRKGTQHDLDSYSAFFENDKITPTGLQAYCRERGFSELSFCGLATDFCVGYSALDALKCGFKANIYLQACRGIDINNSLNHMLTKLQKNGAELLLGA